MGKVLTAVCISLMLLSMALTGCNNGCTELRSAIPRADFYSSSTHTQIALDSMMIIGVGAPGDSAIYNLATRSSTVYLPMPALQNSVQWRFVYTQAALVEVGLADTLTLQFERTPWFAGDECGAMYKYKITNLECTNYIIDSVALLDRVVTNVEKINMEIYFRTGS